MNNDRFYYFSEHSLSREVYVPQTFTTQFTKQFDDLDNEQLFNLVCELYDFTIGDNIPDRHDREELLSYIYEYAYNMVEVQ